MIKAILLILTLCSCVTPKRTFPADSVADYIKVNKLTGTTEIVK